MAIGQPSSSRIAYEHIEEKSGVVIKQTDGRGGVRKDLYLKIDIPDDLVGEVDEVLSPGEMDQIKKREEKTQKSLKELEEEKESKKKLALGDITSDRANGFEGFSSKVMKPRWMQGSSGGSETLEIEGNGFPSQTMVDNNPHLTEEALELQKQLEELFDLSR